jgi:hypothetical protein
MVKQEEKTKSALFSSLTFFSEPFSISTNMIRIFYICEKSQKVELEKGTRVVEQEKKGLDYQIAKLHC